MDEKNILEVENLKKWFPVSNSGHGKNRLYVKAVDGITLKVAKGETVGIVGESGCGKSTFGRTIIKLTEPTEGKIWFEGKDITPLSPKEMRPYRCRIQMMFQDPYASLDPRMTVADIIAEPMDLMKLNENKKVRQDRITELMEECGINRSFMNRYPHEFSGGQRQRIGIARALSVQPQMIICDEPVSALDVSIQSQIINLLVSLQQKHDLTLLFISHDLGVVEYIADRVAVMYLGRVVEYTDKKKLFSQPVHPYTIALMESIPQIGGKKYEKGENTLEGDIPSPIHPPAGCPFHTRCREATEECSKQVPQLHDIGEGHMVSCLKH